jgi:hypothetical protein
MPVSKSWLIRKIQYIVINYINLFDFDDEIEMKIRSTIQTLTFVQTNPDHLYMKLNMKLVVVYTIIHSFDLKKLAPCKNFSWVLLWLLTFKTGTWRFFWLLLFGSQSSPCDTLSIFSHSWHFNFNRFSIRVTWRLSLVEQDCWPLCRTWIQPRLFLFYIMLEGSYSSILSFLCSILSFIIVFFSPFLYGHCIALSVLQITDSDYPFGIF